jgi:type IV secretory pathway TrbF-like protein
MWQKFRPPTRLSRQLTSTALDGLTLHETLYGSLARRSSLKNGLIAALVLLLGYAVVQLSFYANKTRYIPYILIQQTDGSYHVLSTPDPQWSPNDMLAQEDIRQLIYALRAVLMDPTENTRRWERVLARTTTKGRHHAEAAYWELKEKLKTFRGMIQVEIPSILTRQELQTYEVVWNETRFDENKDKIRTADGFTRWRGIFTVKFDRALAHPATAPDGILYEAWSISEEK